MLIGSVSVLSILLAVLWCVLSGGFTGLGWLWMLPVGFVAAFLAQAVLIFVTVWILSKTIDLNKPQEEDSAFFRWMLGVLSEKL